MRAFNYLKVRREDAAHQAQRSTPGARLLAGGTSLVDLAREHIEAPTLLVDVNALPLAGVEARADGVRIGALARMSDVAAHPLVRARYPVVAQALELSASAQIRNMASIGGNLMQRTRCLYFRDTAFRCNKRQPGAGCDALAGVNRDNALLGTSPGCIALHPSDLAVALVALGARLLLRGPDGERRVLLRDFLRLPGATPWLEHDLRPGELIVAVDLPAAPPSSHYLKVRDRASYQFAVVSVAALLEVRGGLVRQAGLALGGVGTRPWRVPAAERLLIGHPPSAARVRLMADRALRGAVAREHNAFKIELARRAVVRAFETLAALT